MKWIPDSTGRFRTRPYYEKFELDEDCERAVMDFLRNRYGTVAWPISTDDLTVLIEQNGATLDSHADLSAYGTDAEGVSIFRREGPPMVGIARHLAVAPHRAARHRMTLAHELSHVRIHGPLFARQLALDAVAGEQVIVDKNVPNVAAADDWMEWQAIYAAGATLMPRLAVISIVEECRRARRLAEPVWAGSNDARDLEELIARTFFASVDAARVRLPQLGLVLIPRVGGKRVTA